MTDPITDAAVEAAAQAAYEDVPAPTAWVNLVAYERDYWLDRVRPIVEAAAPHIAAQALLDAAMEFAVIPHPYEGGVTSWLRDRADAEEGS